MVKRKGPKPRFGIGEWVAYTGATGNRFVGRVVESNGHLGTRTRSYGLIVYVPVAEPFYTSMDEDWLEPAAPAEAAAHAALAATQTDPPLFRDPEGPVLD